MHVAGPRVRQSFDPAHGDQSDETRYQPVVPRGGAVGAKEILFVAKHTGGFCWWHTETSYGIKKRPGKMEKGTYSRNSRKILSQARIELGIYVYPGDDRWGAASAVAAASGSRQTAGIQQGFRRQLTEVLSRYGEITEVWFDGSCLIDVRDILRKHAPSGDGLSGDRTRRSAGGLNETGLPRILPGKPSNGRMRPAGLPP